MAGRPTKQAGRQGRQTEKADRPTKQAGIQSRHTGRQGRQTDRTCRPTGQAGRQGRQPTRQAANKAGSQQGRQPTRQAANKAVSQQGRQPTRQAKLGQYICPLLTANIFHQPLTELTRQNKADSHDPKSVYVNKMSMVVVDFHLKDFHSDSLVWLGHDGRGGGLKDANFVCLPARLPACLTFC